MRAPSRGPTFAILALGLVFAGWMFWTGFQAQPPTALTVVASSIVVPGPEGGLETTIDFESEPETD